MNWSVAYARQAGSDLAARECLLDCPRLPECHQLQYLQMACEKLCKAYLASRGVDPEVLRRSHGFIAGPLPIIARQILARDAGRFPKQTWVLSAIRKLARRIELLAPSVDHAGSVPANTEYPWALPSGEVIAPADFALELTILHERAGVTLLKLVRTAIDDLVGA